MSNEYINMRLKMPQFIHDQLVRKQEDRRQRGLEPLRLSDIVITMLMESLMQEHWQKRATEKAMRTN